MRILELLSYTVCLLASTTPAVSQSEHPHPLSPCPGLVLQNNGFVTDTVQMLCNPSQQQITGLCGTSQLVLETLVDDTAQVTLRVYRHIANDVVRILFNSNATDGQSQASQAGLLTPCAMPGVCDGSSAIASTLQSAFAKVISKIDDYFVNGYLHGRKIYIAGYRDGGPLSVVLAVHLYNKYSILPTTLMELEESSSVWDGFFVGNVLTPFYLRSGIQGRWWSISIHYDPIIAASPTNKGLVYLRGTSPSPLGNMDAVDMTKLLPAGIYPFTTTTTSTSPSSSNHLDVAFPAPDQNNPSEHFSVESVKCAINVTELPNVSDTGSLENYRYALHGESCVIF